MPRLHLLADNDDLSDEEYAGIRAILDEVRVLHLESAQFVSDHGLDPEIFLPGNIWARLNAPEHFTNWTYDLINDVRLVSPLSGFHLMMWGRLDVPGEVDGDKAADLYSALFSGGLRREDLPARLERDFDLSARIRQGLPRMAAFYDEMIATMPSRYRIGAPPRGGEIGGVHEGRILNPDVVLYQRRVNALYAAGALQPIEDAIAAHGSANYLEIGPGHAFLARALAECFGGALRVYLIDLPFVIANGCAYLGCTAGRDAIELVTAGTHGPSRRPFVFVPNYLVPHYERHLPAFHLVHNAISLNEMNERQVGYYLDLVARHLAPGGVFHLAGAAKVLDDHVDAAGAAIRRFPDHVVHTGRHIGGHLVAERPNVFIRHAASGVRA